jgi:serine/threonine protein kinase
MESSRTDSLNIKMTDFGFASFYNPEDGLDEVLGSPLYMAPEIISNQVYNSKVDIWSIGVVAYILLSGRPPFRGNNKYEILESTKKPLSFEHPNWRKISQEAKNFVSSSLSTDPKKRPTALELLEHPWMKSVLQGH